MNTKTIANILIVTLLLALTTGAHAAKRSEVSAQKAQTKAQTAKTCRRKPPPFMYNPRFMNRGFFKRKCVRK